MSVNIKAGLKFLFKRLDTFGQPIQMSYRGSTEYKTWIGGVVTVLLAGVIVALSFEAILSLILRDNIKVSFTKIYESDPYRIEFTNESFVFMLGFNPDVLNARNRKHFILKADQRRSLRLKNGTVREFYEPLSLRQCEPKDFPDGYDYVKYGVQNYTCLEFKKISLEGRFESDNFEFVRLTVDQCKNSTSVTCAPAEETLKILQNNKVYLNVLFSNKIINLQDYNKPFSYFLEASVFFLIDPLKYFKQADINLQHNTIVRDDNLWFYSVQQSSEVTFDNFREQVMDISPNSTRFSSLYLRSSVYRASYTASAEKLTLMLARLGGLISLLFSIVRVFARVYTRRRLLVSMANLMYNFIIASEGTQSKYESRSLDQGDGNGEELPRPGDKKSRRDFAKVQPQEGQTHSIIVQNFTDSRKFSSQTSDKPPANESQGDDSNSRSGLLAQIQKYLSSFSKVKLGFFLRWSSQKKSKDLKSEKSNVLKKAIKRIEKDFDVIQILQKVKEVDKLKEVFFDSDQRTLFEFFPKPVITAKGGVKQLSSFKRVLKRTRIKRRKITNEYIKRLTTNNREEIQENEASPYIELFKAYKNASSPEKAGDKTNQKLVSSLGSTILNIFKKHHS